MKRITVTLTDEQHERLKREAARKRTSVSEVFRAALDHDASCKPSPFEGLIGIVSKKLPYSARDVDAELEKTYADAIRNDRG
jgi:hypothetical protein